MSALSTLCTQARTQMFKQLVERGRIDPLDELAENLGVSLETLQAALQELERQHLVALSPSAGGPWMLHPFSNVPTNYRVQSEDQTWFANCAWDALCIPSLIDRPATIIAPWSDPGLGPDDSMHLQITAQGPREHGGFVHFKVPPGRLWEDIGRS